LKSIAVSIIKWILIFSVALIIQSTIAPKFAILGAYPDLALIALFVLATESGSLSGIWSGFLLGLLIDVYSAGIFGINALANTVVGGAAGFFVCINVIVELAAKLLILFFMVVVRDIFFFILKLYKAKEGIGELPRFLAFYTFPLAVYTVLIATLIFLVLEYFPTDSRR
jgi:rod shape-determining protein MreD